MSKNTKKAPTCIVQFFRSEGLVNVISGQKEEYSFYQRDNINYYQVIVRFLYPKYNTCEYRIYNLREEAKLKLHDYLIGCFLDNSSSLHEDHVFHCPDTGETCSYAEIQASIKEGLNQLIDRFTIKGE